MMVRVVTGLAITFLGGCGFCRLITAQDAGSPYLQAAIETANWLDAVAIRSGEVCRWPTAPDESLRSVDNLYSGNAGVVLFYRELYLATGRREYLDSALAGANGLVQAVALLREDSDLGLFTGAAGIGYVLYLVGSMVPDEKYRAAAQAVVDHIHNHARVDDENGIACAAWNDVTDIIGGTAGIGVFLLDAHQRTADVPTLQLAIAAGDGLIGVAEVVGDEPHRQWTWRMSPENPREMPNYSHGTAGICHFLLMLDDVCRRTEGTMETYDGRFQRAAEDGARYLMGLMNARNVGLIPHHLPGGEDLYYLGWCHGPAGTVRLFDQLAGLTGDPKYQEAANRLWSALIQWNVPQRSDGFWDNVGLCCGNCGIVAAGMERDRPENDFRLLSERLLDDLLQRATRQSLANGRAGLKWVHCEHRVRPEFQQAQTGLMQGAAGIGITLIVYDAQVRHRPRDPILTVLPF